MFRAISILVPVVIFVGCRPQPAPPAAGKATQDASQGEHRAQPRIGGGASDEEWGLLPFEILKIDRNQKPTDASPGHADGGEWTFFDCRTGATNPATFTVGVFAKPGKGSPFAFGEATLVVADRDEGTKLLAAVGTAFHEDVPPTREPQPLTPWKFATAVLGEGMQRESQGGFKGEGGHWSATKWFLQRDGLEAEVFFNYNLKEMKGEFSEKDPEYREQLLAVLAITLRDGPRPERTPQSDSNLTDLGPTFGPERLVAKEVRAFQFGPGGKSIVFSQYSPDGSTVLFALSPDRPDEPLEIARVQKELGGTYVLDPDVRQLLLVEVLSKERGLISSKDGKRLLWVDRTKQEMRELTGPWRSENMFIARQPVSPDGRFVALHEWRPQADATRGNYAVIHVYALKSGTTHTIELANEPLEPVGWVGSGDELRLAFLKGYRRDPKVKQEWFLGDPSTGQFVSVEEPPFPSDEEAERLSPDGSLVASIEENNRLTLTNVKTNETRSFVFHEEDLPFVHEDAFEWLSPRYLLLHVNRLAFLDAQTLKISYPLPLGSASRGETFSPDFRWALWRGREEGLYVSPMILPDAE